MKKTTSQKILKHLGTVMMIVPVLFLLYIYYPIMQVYFFPSPIPPAAAAQSNEFSITIQKINGYAPIIENVKWLDEKEYTEALKKGVAHAKGFALPDQQGTVFLFAHSSDSPWNITRYNTVFFRLNELQNGDSIQINYHGKTYTYRVNSIQEVWPTQTDAVLKSKHDLILQTCTPIGTSLKRLLVFADKQ